MSLRFEYLIDCPIHCKRVIHWWNEEWASHLGPDLKKAEQELRRSLSKSELPIHLLAFENDVPAGTAALKLQELDEQYPQYHYWLGSVFVATEFRGSKIASQLTNQVIHLAKSMALPHLYLQTSNLTGGLYAKLGWEPVEQFSHDGEENLLMLKTLS
ncbi:MAG: GNAT family N-acetyltransferase [Pseudohongiellaceae bacterium]